MSKVVRVRRLSIWPVKIKTKKPPKWMNVMKSRFNCQNECIETHSDIS